MLIEESTDKQATIRTFYKHNYLFLQPQIVMIYETSMVVESAVQLLLLPVLLSLLGVLCVLLLAKREDPRRGRLARSRGVTYSRNVRQRKRRILCFILSSRMQKYYRNGCTMFEIQNVGLYFECTGEVR